MKEKIILLAVGALIGATISTITFFAFILICNYGKQNIKVQNNPIQEKSKSKINSHSKKTEIDTNKNQLRENKTDQADTNLSE